jgi:2-polyprenyl-6-methoxyphenol hydroxylase-like FAD-dependent oxidoreductase
VDTWRPHPFSQGAFSGAGEVLNDIYAGIDVDIAVRNNQAWIYRISYQVTLIGLLAYNPVINKAPKQATGMRVGIIGGSVAGCATAALLHRAGHDVTVFERSESDLVSRGAGIGTPTAVWQDMMTRGLIDKTLSACRADYMRYVTRGPGTGQPRWLGDAGGRGSLMLLNWAHLYQCLRRGVPDDLYRSASTVELIEARPDGTTLHLRPCGSVEFDLVVCADGYRSTGRGLIDPGATPCYRGIVSWRGLLRESDIGVDALDGCDLLRVGYLGGHGVLYYIPGSGQSTEPGSRLLVWGYYLQVPEDALSSVLVDDQERQQSGSVPFGKVHPQVGAGLEARLATLLPPVLFKVMQQSRNSAIQAIYSIVPRSYTRDRMCLVGDAGALFPPFTTSGVLKAVANVTSLADALAGAPAIGAALGRWSRAQLQVAAQVMPRAEHVERSEVFDMPDLTTLPTTAANDWMTSHLPGYVLTLPDG